MPNTHEITIRFKLATDNENFIRTCSVCIFANLPCNEMESGDEALNDICGTHGYFVEEDVE